jgi:hypothetical protein
VNAGNSASAICWWMNIRIPTPASMILFQQHQILGSRAAPRVDRLIVIAHHGKARPRASWRGARPQNLVLLKEDFPALEVVKLEQNYRSSQFRMRWEER